MLLILNLFSVESAINWANAASSASSSRTLSKTNIFLIQILKLPSLTFRNMHAGGTLDVLGSPLGSGAGTGIIIDVLHRVDPPT